MTERIGHDETTERELFVLDLERPEALPDALAIPSEHFACLLAWDANATESATIELVARRLLNAGAVYVCAWGQGCERVHDLVDQQIFHLGRGAGPEAVVMTTWHDGEPLAEAIWFLLHVAWPDDAYFDACRASIGIAIGCPGYAAEMRTAFRDPRAFSALVMAQE